MNPQKIELVILDLDGTILDLYRHAPVSKAVRAAIDAVQARGIPVTIATGRTLDYVREHVAPLGIGLPVVTGQGSVIGDPHTGQVLEELPLSRAAATRAAAWIDAHDYVAALYFTAQNIGERAGDGPAPTIQIYQNRAGEDTAFYDHVLGPRRTLAHDFSTLVAQSPTLPLKFIVAEEGDASAPDAASGGASAGGFDLVQALQAALGKGTAEPGADPGAVDGGLTITRTHPRLVEGTAAGVDKGAGVLRLCARLGVDPARVLAIGDSDNDIPMLQVVGFGIGMGNASPGVQKAARWLAPAVEQDGVAVALQRWILDVAPE